MSTPSPLEDVRNQVLQKIGRNLVNAQKLEAMLKRLLAVNQVEGFASQIEELAERKAKWASKLTMGQVIQELSVRLFDDRSTTQGQLGLAPEIWMSMKTRLEGGQKAADEWSDELRGVLNERNELVHHMLASFDADSIESCEQLGVELDAQRARLMPVYEQVQATLVAFKEACEELLQAIPARVSGSPIKP